MIYVRLRERVRPHSNGNQNRHQVPQLESARRLIQYFFATIRNGPCHTFLAALDREQSWVYHHRCQKTSIMGMGSLESRVRILQPGCRRESLPPILWPQVILLSLYRSQENNGECTGNLCMCLGASWRQIFRCRGVKPVSLFRTAAAHSGGILNHCANGREVELDYNWAD